MTRAGGPDDVPVGFAEDARSDISKPGTMLSGGEIAEEKPVEATDLGLERSEVPITETITGAEPQGLPILVVEKA